jgi:hypothetical protein
MRTFGHIEGNRLNWVLVANVTRQFRNSKFEFRNLSGARGEIRASHKAEFKSAASSNWATRAKNCELQDCGIAAGLIAYCRQARFNETDRVLFWHTGGLMTLF